MKTNRLHFSLAACLFALAGFALAAVPDYQLTLDVQTPDAEWALPRVFAGATPLIRVNFQRNGLPFTPSSDWAGFLWYGTKTDWTTGAIAKIPGSFSNAWSWADFQAASTNFTAAGSYYGGVVMTNTAGQLIEWGLGRIVIRESAGLGSSTALTLGTNVNWGTISGYLGSWPITIAQAVGYTNAAAGSGSSSGYSVTVTFSTNLYWANASNLVYQWADLSAVYWGRVSNGVLTVTTNSITP
jgi:hypothetical protein